MNIFIHIYACYISRFILLIQEHVIRISYTQNERNGTRIENDTNTLDANRMEENTDQNQNRTQTTKAPREPAIYHHDQKLQPRTRKHDRNSPFSNQE